MSSIRLLPPVGTIASLAIDGPAAATFNTVIEAVAPAYEGPLGNTITLALAATGTWVPNVGTLTLVANPGDTETVTIGANVYTFQTVLTDVAGNVLIGASASATLDNLIAAINAAAGAGTTYAAATTVHPTVRAFAGAGDTMVVHTKTNTILTAVGTLIATTDGMANAGNVWGAATLADGTDGTNVTFTVTGTAIACSFASGYSTVSDFEAALAADASVAALVQVRTAGTTPLYQLLVTDDDFTATNLSGGGSTASNPPTLTDDEAGKALPFTTDQGTLLIRSTAGSGTMTGTVRLWGYFPATSQWYALGTGASAQGVVNGGVAMAEISTVANTIQQAEVVAGLRRCTRLHAEIVGALGGTGTELEIVFDAVPATAVSTS